MRVLIVVAMIASCSYDPHSIGGPGSDATPNGDSSGAGDGANGDGPVADAPPNQVTCPGSMCGAECCEGVCTDPALGICAGTLYECDGPEDCNPGQVCCNNKNGSSCKTGTTCTGGLAVCHVGQDCPSGCTSCSFEGDYRQKVCCE